MAGQKKKTLQNRRRILVRSHPVSVPYPGRILAIAGRYAYVQDTARVWHTYLVWSDQDYVFGFAVKMPTARMLHDHTRGHVTTCHNGHLLTSLLLVCFDPCPFSFLRSFPKPRSLTNFSPKFSKTSNDPTYLRDYEVDLAKAFCSDGYSEPRQGPDNHRRCRLVCQIKNPQTGNISSHQEYIRTRVCNSILWGLSRQNSKFVIDDAQPLSFQVVMHSTLNTCMQSAGLA